MKTNQKIIFKTLNALTWVIFIGLCIKTGAILFTFLFSLFVNPAATADLYLGLDLSGLRAHSQASYVLMLSLVTVIWALKAFLFYRIIQLFPKAKYSSPFTPAVVWLISQAGMVTLVAGLLAALAEAYHGWLLRSGVLLDGLLPWVSGGAELLLMVAILLVIAFVFRRGVEFQAERELTI